jgi:hypothetical protein
MKCDVTVSGYAFKSSERGNALMVSMHKEL